MADQGATFASIAETLTNKSEGDSRKRLNYLRRYGPKVPGVKKYIRPGPWNPEDDQALLTAVSGSDKALALAAAQALGQQGTSESVRAQLVAALRRTRGPGRPPIIGHGFDP